MIKLFNVHFVVVKLVKFSFFSLFATGFMFRWIKVSYVIVVVCLFVCLSVCLLAILHKNSQRICMKFSWKFGNGLLTKWLNFGDDPHHGYGRIATLVRSVLAEVCTVDCPSSSSFMYAFDDVTLFINYYSITWRSELRTREEIRNYLRYVPADYDDNPLKFWILKQGFWATVCKTVRPMLSDRCLSVCPGCLFCLWR